MTIYINHQFHYETENLVRLFFPNDKLNVVREEPSDNADGLVTVLILGDRKGRYALASAISLATLFFRDDRNIVSPPRGKYCASGAIIHKGPL